MCINYENYIDNNYYLTLVIMSEIKLLSLKSRNFKTKKLLIF